MTTEEARRIGERFEASSARWVKRFEEKWNALSEAAAKTRQEDSRRRVLEAVRLCSRIVLRESMGVARDEWQAIAEAKGCLRPPIVR